MADKHEIPLITKSQNLFLPLPELEDSNDVLKIKMRLLVAIIRAKKSIAIATNFAAGPVQERDATKEAVSMMPPDQLEAWTAYNGGRIELPQIDWTSENPLAGEVHYEELLSAGMTAVARVLAAERDQLGGQYSLNATQWADLQTINKVLSLSGRITKANQRKGIRAEVGLRSELQLRAVIGDYQAGLAGHRAWLRGQFQEVQNREEDLIAILGTRNKF